LNSLIHIFEDAFIFYLNLKKFENSILEKSKSKNPQKALKYKDL